MKRARAQAAQPVRLAVVICPQGRAGRHSYAVRIDGFRAEGFTPSALAAWARTSAIMKGELERLFPDAPVTPVVEPEVKP